MPKFFFLLLLFLSLPGFCQEETVKEPLSPEGGKVIIRGAPAEPETAPVPAPAVDAASAPAVDPATMTDDEAAIEQLEAEKRKQIEQFQKIQKTTEPIKETMAKSPLEEIKALGHKQLGAAALMDDKVLAILQKSLKEGGMGKLPEEAVRKSIQEKMKGSWLEKIVAAYPPLLDIFVDVLRDKEAMPGLLNILQRKDDLKTYGYVWLAMFVFTLWMKGRIIKPKWKFSKRFTYSSGISLVLSLVAIYLFWSMFQSELSPTINIIARHI